MGRENGELNWDCGSDEMSSLTHKLSKKPQLITDVEHNFLQEDEQDQKASLS